MVRTPVRYSGLTPEESFLWSCARAWPNHPDLSSSPDLDWDRIITIGLTNRMQVLLKDLVVLNGLTGQLSPQAYGDLTKAVKRSEHSAAFLKEALSRYLNYAAQDHDVVVLKGLWLSEIIYGRASMRPGADIDLLVREEDIGRSIAVLEEDMGYGTWWRPLLDDRYYQRHHLHQQRCNHDRSIWIEPHWRLDHPYNLLTIDYQAMMNRTEPGELWGISLRTLSPPDLLLSLAVHLVKHAVYLPVVLERPDLSRLILADGMLMYFADIDQAIRYYGSELDWQGVVNLALSSGAANIMGSVLRVCSDYLNSRVPAWVLDQLAVTGIGPLTRLVMDRLADYEIHRYLGQSNSRLWSYLLGYQASIVFRPIRLLDLIHYVFPNGDYLDRKYGSASAFNRVTHLLRALGQYAVVARDTVYFTWLRRRQVRELDRLGFSWPELPTFEE